MHEGPVSKADAGAQVALGEVVRRDLRRAQQRTAGNEDLRASPQAEHAPLRGHVLQSREAGDGRPRDARGAALPRPRRVSPRRVELPGLGLRDAGRPEQGRRDEVPLGRSVEQKAGTQKHNLVQATLAIPLKEPYPLGGEP